MNVATLTNSLKALFGTAASSTAITSTDLVPFMNSSGTPSGLSSISQLVSVLGEMCYGKNVTTLAVGTDLNTLAPGYYRTTLSNTTNSLVNRPSEVTEYLTWIACIGLDTNNPQTYRSQIMIASHYGIFWRMSESNNWGSWKKISMS